jgi:predicted Zn-dependent protease
MSGRFLRTLGALGIGLGLAGCTAPNPSAPQTYDARSASEQREGDQAHPQILQQFGGAYTRGGVDSYVNDIGVRLAANSEQPDAKWTFTVLDSPVINAFALPGGYVYVTRGLIALANSEAELAGVIGHEIGHVTAAHSVQRQQQSAIAQAGVLAAVIGAAILGADPTAVDAVGKLGSTVGQGTVASFSRGQELEADSLGVRYLARTSYDPFAQADFLKNMAAQSELSAKLAGQGFDPNRVDFFASHPASADRVHQAIAAARQQGVEMNENAPRNRERFLAEIDGMTYGDSVDQGFVRGRRFVHPKLGFEFTVPPGFEIINSAASVTARGPRGSGVIFDGGRDPGGALDAYISGQWAPQIAKQTRVGQLQGLRTLRINGMDAATGVMPVATNSGTRAARMTVIRTPGGRLYRFLGIADPNDSGALAGVEQAAQTFRTLSAAEAAAFRPWRIDVVTVRPGDTVERLAARMPFDTANAERFRVLNGLGPNEPLRVGEKVKLVVQ